MRPGGETTCGRHPGVAAVTTCRRCGTFCCPDCLEIPSSDGLCIECAARPGLALGGHFTLSATALLLSFLGLALVPLAPLGVGLAAWVLARGETKTWKERALPVAAIVLGALGLVLAVVFVLVARRNGVLP
jgi:hypothetical protein